MLNRILGSNLLTSSAIYLFSNALSAAIPFVLLPVLTRYLSPAEYGQVAIYQTLLIGLAAFIGITAQGAAAVKYYERGISQIELKYYVGNCLLIAAITTLLMFLVATAFLRSLSAWLLLSPKWLLLSVVVASANFVVAMRMVQWQIRRHAKQFGVFQVSQSLVNMLLSLVFVVQLSQGAPGRILVLSITPIGYAIVALILLRRGNLLGFVWRRNYVYEIVAYGVPLIPHSLGYFLLSSVDRLVINDRLGAAQVGIYMVAVQLASAMGLLLDSINSAYVPWLFERLKRNELEEKRQLVRWTYIYFLVLVAVVPLAFTIGAPMLVLIVGQKYAAAGTAVGWLVVGWVFHGMYLMVTNYVYFSKRTGLLSLSTITAGLLNVGLLLVLVAYLGLRGAAMAFAISSALKFATTWYIAQLSYPMPWFSFRSTARSRR